jgi:cytoskeletal protein RodZ
VGIGRAILRGIKLAAYGFAGLLVCLVVYDVMTLAPEAHTPSVAPDQDAAAVAEPSSGHPSAHSFGRESSATVPPPPPLPGQAKSAAANRRVAAAKQPQGTQDAVKIREVDAAELSRLAPLESTGAAGPTRAETPTAAVKDPDAPAAIVIVRPPVRAPQENRGLRWIKAVGRALHIGGDKDE